MRALPLLGAVASGGLFALAFPGPDVAILAWVALVPLLLAARRRTAEGAFGLGCIWGIVAYGLVFRWLLTFGPVVWALAVLLLAVFPGVALLLLHWFERDYDGPWTFAAVAAVWTAVEFLQSRGPLGFPWALLGVTQHAALPVLQTASLAGVFGVSFLVALVNGALYTVLAAPRRAALALCVTAAVLGGALAWGAAALRRPAPPGFIAAAIQPNVATTPTRRGPDVAGDLRRLAGLTDAAARRGAALVVWPETASPLDIMGPAGAWRLIARWARRDRLTVIATSLERGRWNDAFAIAPSGAVAGPYEKARLVPFAEAGEEPGRQQPVLQTAEGGIGVAICFESIFPDLARRAVRRGAALLAVVTNDAWFDGRTAPVQHLALAPFRAVEEGRYLIRAANEGVSAIFDPRGRVLASLPLGTPGVLTAPVAAVRGLTPYARVGDSLAWAAVAAAAAIVAPRARAFLSAEAGAPAFVRLAVDSAAPFVALAAAQWASLRLPIAAGGWGPMLAPAVLLAATALLSVRRSAAELGFRLTGFAPAAVLGLAFVGALVWIARHAFAVHGVAVPFEPPPGGWWWGTTAAVLVVGLSLEWWLRGLVFADAAAWRGWKPAVIWSGLLGVAAAAVRGPETMAWALCSGLVFGLIRARWPQVPALALAHGAGAVVLAFLISPW